MKHEKHPERRRVRASLRPFLLPSAQVLPERTGQHGCGPASASAPRRAAPARGGEAGMNIPLDPRARAPNILPAGGLSLGLGPRARAPALRPDPTAAACDRTARRENGVSPRPNSVQSAPSYPSQEPPPSSPRRTSLPGGFARRKRKEREVMSRQGHLPLMPLRHSGDCPSCRGCRAPFQRCTQRGCRTLFSPAPFRTGRESGADRRNLRPERARGLFAAGPEKQNGADL